MAVAIIRQQRNTRGALRNGEVAGPRAIGEIAGAGGENGNRTSQRRIDQDIVHVPAFEVVGVAVNGVEMEPDQDLRANVIGEDDGCRAPDADRVAGKADSTLIVAGNHIKVIPAIGANLDGGLVPIRAWLGLDKVIEAEVRRVSHGTQIDRRRCNHAFIWSRITGHIGGIIGSPASRSFAESIVDAAGSAVASL